MRLRLPSLRSIGVLPSRGAYDILAVASPVVLVSVLVPIVVVVAIVIVAMIVIAHANTYPAVLNTQIT